MIFGSKKIKQFEERIEVLEKMLSDKESNLCPNDQTELMETTSLGEGKRRMTCPRCGQHYFHELKNDV